jgi:hypothetical protein
MSGSKYGTSGSKYGMSGSKFICVFKLSVTATEPIFLRLVTAQWNHVKSLYTVFHTNTRDSV